MAETLRPATNAHNFFEKIFHLAEPMLILNPVNTLRFFTLKEVKDHGTKTPRSPEGVSRQD
jgi:hypothetical protein